MITVGFDISALDESFKEHAQRGIGRYVRELKNGFSTCTSSQVQITDFDHRTFVPDGIINKVPVGKMTLKQQVIFPTRLWLQGNTRFDIFHFPAQMDAPSWCRVPYILTVLDLIPLVCADLYKADRPGWRFLLARWLEKKAIQNASMILAISENTARDVERILSIPAERIRVTPLGVDPSFFLATRPSDEVVFRKRYGIAVDRPIILYVGGIDQRKNYRGMVSVLAAVKSRCELEGLPVPVLVMAGRIERDRQYPKLLQAIDAAGVSADVCMPGFVPDVDLLPLYTISSVFLFLSLYEGFGLPVLEAMAAGTPVVAANTSSIPEVMGATGLAVAPEDTTAAADAVLQILTNPEFASELSRAGREQAKSFTWERTAQTTLAAYEECAAGINNRRAAHA